MLFGVAAVVVVVAIFESTAANKDIQLVSVLFKKYNKQNIKFTFVFL